MQFSTFLATLLSVAATANAGCYSGGESGQYGKGLIKDKIIDTVCNAMHGAYLDGEDRHQCATDEFKTKWNFYIKNKNGDRESITFDYCKQKLGNEAYACEHGGESTIDKWQFVSDPNKGQCVDRTNW
ncbi:hypothetical protein GGS26DRAFT_594961 [Hypomontagnella submonticulosa]|nr:hypothetical protein GGS26DRAFT_594961 [Hypomontagnella submonticulosa]